MHVPVEMLLESTAHGAVQVKLQEDIPFIAISYLQPAPGHALQTVCRVREYWYYLNYTTIRLPL